MYQVFRAQMMEDTIDYLGTVHHTDVESIEDGVAELLTLRDGSELRVSPELHDGYVLCRKGLSAFDSGVDYNWLVEHSQHREKELLNPSPRIIFAHLQ